MKVQCDVCAAAAASVFCCADEAALCDACDRRVHRANKLAGKHRRFSLLNPPPPSSASSGAGLLPPPPLCDICQGKRGFLFCKEDRAILCRECDVSVHTVSDLTMSHTRFLLTGVRISSEPAACPAPPPEEETSSFCCSGDDDDDAPPAPATSQGGSSSSSISEYLTKTLPGWHVEDFLVDDATAAAAAAAAAATSTGISADGSYLQGVTRNGGLHEAPSWMAHEQLCRETMAHEQLCRDGVVVAGGAMVSRERWVPQMYTEPAGSKRSRTSAASYPYW